MKNKMKCAYCKNKICLQGRDCVGITKEIIQSYSSNREVSKIVKIASSVEKECYMKSSRLEELIVFCNKMKYKHLGIAFCIGLEEETNVLHKILEKQNFNVISVCCKVCGIQKNKFNLEQFNKTKSETMCNPLGQAKILNLYKTELNILFGLCIGHDILFTEYSSAPVTTLVVKDRALAHNPIGAIYSGYYRRNKFNNK